MLADFLARFSIPFAIAIIHLTGNPTQIWQKSVHQNNGIEQIKLYDEILRISDHTLSSANKEGEGPTEYYDYVIVGGGAAGAVVANRLSADGNYTVLLLEGGGDPNPSSEIPLAQLLLWESEMVMKYVGVPQERACLQNGGVCAYPRGRALGGSSSVNGLLYNRCNPKDYDYWAEFTNDTRWSFASVLDAFKSLENYHGFYEDDSSPNHGAEGEMHVGKLEFLPGVDELFAALEEKGVPIGDLNSGLFPYGFSKIDSNIKDGLRWSSYHAFIKPIEARENFKIYRYAWATKIHFNETNHAIGVSYMRHGQERYVGANKEIILSAGVFDTPKLLMLSGIGPRQHLEEHSIPVIVDSPAIGSNFQDHPGVSAYPFAINKSLGLVDYLTPENVAEFVTTGTGPLLMFPTSIGFANFAPQIANGYISSTHSDYNDRNWPDLHVYIHEQVLTPGNGVEEETIFFDIELVRSEQVGTVRLASGNYSDDVLIDGKFFENIYDVERILDGIEFMTDIFLNSSTFQSLGIKWSENVPLLPACSQYTFPSREHWRCYVHQTAVPYYHPTSTCRMGPNITVAGVDSKLRVFGTSGLRVIDSSVFVRAPNGNTNIPSMMVGEMGARIIIEEQ
ncbi:uncharacterized GMC-type oxidoreductase Mb1310 [Folsomia candida]|uniref:Glucose dehydrogenase [FAD, quinone] n=1 Tax=Folsomia candida TaxID=158441 RepID=A0A226F222_FOLCA|nr:uncharacterized GMC-type oxidoreductase Mb1310 [Folsomia candida]OXA63508.1 Glucose dehydrogenase [FAD, quinone] [Folsomia candida]